MRSQQDFAAEAVPAAWAVFTGQTELRWLKLLKPGFRHCFVLLNDGRHWITVDPLSPFMEVAVQPVGADFDLPGWLAQQGLVVTKTIVRRGVVRPAPWSLFTCVEAVKRVLGIHARLVVTPWQLYRRLAALSPDKTTP